MIFKYLQNQKSISVIGKYFLFGSVLALVFSFSVASFTSYSPDLFKYFPFLVSYADFDYDEIPEGEASGSDSGDEVTYYYETSEEAEAYGAYDYGDSESFDYEDIPEGEASGSDPTSGGEDVSDPSPYEPSGGVSGSDVTSDGTSATTGSDVTSGGSLATGASGVSGSDPTSGSAPATSGSDPTSGSTGSVSGSDPTSGTVSGSDSTSGTVSGSDPTSGTVSGSDPTSGVVSGSDPETPAAPIPSALPPVIELVEGPGETEIAVVTPPTPPTPPVTPPTTPPVDGGAPPTP